MRLVKVFENEDYYVDLDTSEFYDKNMRKLIQSKTYNGYVTVTLYRKRKKVHRLVLMTVTKCDGNGLQVNHKDGDKLNNLYSNLEWCTCKENVAHAERLGLRSHKNTKVRKDRKYSDEEIIIIKKALCDGLSYNEIKEICPRATSKLIYAVKNEQNYKLVKDNTEVS